MKITLKWHVVLASVLLAAGCERAPENPSWQLLASMEHGRSEISAALVGNKVYTVGGVGFFRTLQSCEVLDLYSGDWARCPDLPKPLHHVGLASDGRDVFAAGGYVDVQFTHNDPGLLWRLDEEKAKWVAISSLPEPIGEHAIITFEGGIYIIGGRSLGGDSGALWRFDIVSHDWTRLSDMPTPRNSFAVAMVEGELWILGGRSAALGVGIDKTEIYSFEKNAWRNGPTLPVGRGGHVAVYSVGEVHVIGGELFDPDKMINRHDIYDLKAGVWKKAAQPSYPRHGGAALILPENEILVIGGGASPGWRTIYSASPTVQKYSAVRENQRK